MRPVVACSLLLTLAALAPQRVLETPSSLLRNVQVCDGRMILRSAYPIPTQLGVFPDTATFARPR